MNSLPCFSYRFSPRQRMILSQLHQVFSQGERRNLRKTKKSWPAAVKLSAKTAASSNAQLATRKAPYSQFKI
jgi:hypothetical protein